jgi:hypothetical protein
VELDHETHLVDQLDMMFDLGWDHLALAGRQRAGTTAIDHEPE